MNQELIETSQLPVPVNPMDMAPEEFQAGLDRRKTNRDAMMAWIREALVEGIDFGQIHVIKKSKCPEGRNCKNKSHFSKPSLFKPGAEKICGMLGLTPTYPALQDYEQAALQGNEIRQILINCALVSGSGMVVGEGSGARDVQKQDYGDLNKSIKMALKSAQIDATLRTAGISEVFTQDVEDMNWDEDEEPAQFSRDYILTFGKHQGKALREVDNRYLRWLSENGTQEFIRQFADMELVSREEDGQIPEITAEQINKIHELSKSYYSDLRKFTDNLDREFGVNTISQLNTEQAEKVIAALKWAFEKRERKQEEAEKSSGQVQELLDFAIKQWDVDAATAVESLNKKAGELFNATIIDTLKIEQAMELWNLVKKRKTPF